MTDLVVDKGGANSGAQAEAFAQAARGVVFPAALPSRKMAGGAHAALAGIEAEHDFTKGELVELTVGGGSDREAHEKTDWRKAGRQARSNH